MVRQSYSEQQDILEKALYERYNICATRESISRFPKILLANYYLEQIGVIVCLRGTFSFIVNGKHFRAHEGQTVFLSSGKTFCIEEESEDISISILFYDSSEIREILGDTVITMRLYTLITPGHCEILSTGEEDDICNFISLLSRYTTDRRQPPGSYEERERISLLLAFTYRMCCIFSKEHSPINKEMGRKIEIFTKLIKLIDNHYTSERGVAFYADKLCLSAKYLSTLVKSVCGYTVQEVVFMAIIRRCIFLMRNTNKTIQQISDEMHFPNISAFGTFFKKQTGMSPRQFRNPERNPERKK